MLTEYKGRSGKSLKRPIAGDTREATLSKTLNDCPKKSAKVFHRKSSKRIRRDHPQRRDQRTTKVFARSATDNRSSGRDRADRIAKAIRSVSVVIEDGFEVWIDRNGIRHYTREHMDHIDREVTAYFDTLFDKGEHG